MDIVRMMTRCKTDTTGSGCTTQSGTKKIYGFSKRKIRILSASLEVFSVITLSNRISCRMWRRTTNWIEENTMWLKVLNWKSCATIDNWGTFDLCGDLEISLFVFPPLLPLIFIGALPRTGDWGDSSEQIQHFLERIHDSTIYPLVDLVVHILLVVQPLREHRIAGPIVGDHRK